MFVKKSYSIPEYLEFLEFKKLSNKEKFYYTIDKELEKIDITRDSDKKIYNNLAVVLGVMLYAEKVIAAPTTGIPKLDSGGWKLVGVAQSVIFWAAMIYTFKSLLELTIKGEGSWKKVGTGFLICAMDYLIPWGFEMIRNIFM